ncbi:ribosomal protein l19 [Paraphaeosphaeria sporulosa]
MATAIASAKAGVSQAVLLAAKPPAIAAKSVKGSKLVDAMHRSLYPHLYQQGGGSAPNRKIRQQMGTMKRYKQVEAEREARKVSWFRNKMRTSSSSTSASVWQPLPLPCRLPFHWAWCKLASQPQKPRAIRKACHDPVAAVTSSQLAVHDPTGARTRLFDRANPECARVGDILLVRQRTGEPFAGVCINIRRRGVDTAILLRGQLTRVGIEMWYKVYSPLVEGIEVVQRAQRKTRRARLTYMRKEKHDRGSVENVVRVYLRQKAALGSTDGSKKKGAAAAAAMAGGGKRKGSVKGKKGKKK